MRRVVLSALALTAVAAGAAGAAGADSPAPTADAAATVGVTVGDDFFRPSSLTVRRGTVLRFVWRRTRHPHNVCTRSSCSRTTRRSGAVHRRTVRRSTTYFCSVHPDDMRLRVRVR